MAICKVNPLPWGKQPGAIYIDTMQDDEIDAYMIWVRTLNDQHIGIYVTWNDAIDFIMSRVSAWTCVPVKNMSLFYGEELNCGWTLAHYGIGPGATVKMMNAKYMRNAYRFVIEVKTLLGQTKLIKVTMWHTIDYVKSWLQNELCIHKD